VPRGGCIVEIGTYHGASAINFAAGSLAGNSVQVYAVDPHESAKHSLIGEYGPEDQQAWYTNVALSGLGRLIYAVSLRSVDAAKAFADESIDMLYIDGCHDYEFVISDMRAWSHALKDGALILMHDRYEVGVKRAISERPGDWIALGYVDSMEFLVKAHLDICWPISKIGGFVGVVRGQ
jgi:predicted O-methyltransferase YrrM